MFIGIVHNNLASNGRVGDSAAMDDNMQCLDSFKRLIQLDDNLQFTLYIDVSELIDHL